SRLHGLLQFFCLSHNIWTKPSNRLFADRRANDVRVLKIGHSINICEAVTFLKLVKVFKYNRARYLHGSVEEAVCTAYSKFFALAIIFGLSRAIGFLLTDVQTTSVYSKTV
ncbi:MAG: hypothetical protein K940chlam7_01339, partial [Chlamydiae bacterium]|nr:hypothetical protein [Chlamydiota bacterium]